MRKTLFAIAIIMLAAAAFASGSAETRGYTEDGFRLAIAQKIGHSLEQNESIVADATWSWYDKKWEGKWDADRFTRAVDKGTENCGNQAMLTAAKAGKFGEKLLKALVIAAGDAAGAFSDWVDKNSDRYDETKK